MHNERRDAQTMKKKDFPKYQMGLLNSVGTKYF